MPWSAAYGFVGLMHGEYGRAGSDEKLITVDIYDMGAPLHAFGLFASERAADVTLRLLGQQGYVEAGLGAFWQDRYYVKVSSVAGATNADVQALAAAVAKLLPPATGLPPELRRLPAAHRLPNSERYVRKSALGHRFLREAVSADYHLGKGTAHIRSKVSRPARGRWLGLAGSAAQATRC